MKVMQHTMKNRSEHKRRSDYDNQPGEDCVRARKDFAGSSLELAEWTHAGEDHGCVHIRVRKRHALEVAITSHANDETAPVSYTHLRAHETVLDLVCRLLLEKKK